MSLDRFWATLPFDPDPFQLRAATAVQAGRTVVVSAPTGAGKTVVAEAAIHLARAGGKRAFYTTPLKALSNQKYLDFCEVHGQPEVGLLTGDNVINGGAPVVVMTTEVLRNMIYARSPDLADLGVAVLDEVHYLQDPSRGAVWEEVIIHAPAHVQLVALSATVSNAAAFASWIESRRGPTELVEEVDRPVPLDSLLLMKDLHSRDGLLMFPLFAKGGREPNPEVIRLLARRRARRFKTPRRAETVGFLHERGMLPAIYFIFSRAGCEAAVQQVVHEGLVLTTARERELVRSIAEERTAALSAGELEVLGYRRWLTGLEAGVSPHHAGMVPAFKEAVEELFAAGLVKTVFATETLSLGINMPAKTVVLESMTKFTGEAHQPLQPGDYTQLTGRAGRRGIDARGFGVVLYSPYLNFDHLVGTAAAGSHPIVSSFRPTYNMAVNLVANYDQGRAERLIAASFAQFTQEDRRAGLQRTMKQVTKRLSQAREAVRCERGDAAGYAELVRREGTRGRGSARAQFARRLHQGSILEVPDGARSGRAVVLQRWGAGDTRLLVVGPRADLARIRIRDLPMGTVHLGRIDLPAPYRPKSPGYRARLAAMATDFEALERVSLRSGSLFESHPVHHCPDRQSHLAAADRVGRLERDLEALQERLTEIRQGLATQFRGVRDLLEEWGYLVGWRLTDQGTTLRFLYNEMDLLVAETLRRDLTRNLQPPELAALISAFVYEPRKGTAQGSWPTPALVAAGARLEELWKELTRAEKAHRLPTTRAPEPGLSPLVHGWASGASLEDLLGPDDLAAGDFVRSCRQLIDLLRQVRDASPETADGARAAIELLDRSVVAAGGVT